jgi:hypothetical protein
MKNSLKIEELLLCIAAIYLCFQLPVHIEWWQFLLLFFTPDIGMLGYLINNKAGAIGYNALHHKGIAIALWLCGIILGNFILQFIGLLLLAHSSFDRFFGFGLKYYKGFKHTHLGDLP